RWEAEKEHNDWQPVLWRAIRQLIGAPHLAELWAGAVGIIDAGQVPAGVLPKRLTWLTHPDIARLHLDVFAALSRSGVDAHLFALVPSRDGAHRASESSLAHLNDVTPYPLEIPDYGNPLLESLARHSRDFELLIARASHGQLDETDLFVEPVGSTLLVALQRDVLNGVRRGVDEVKPVTIATTDDSLRVHACHGPTRQVEVLRDELLRLLNDDPTLRPRDIIVLTPVMRDFAPLIDAVFSADRHETRDGKAKAGDRQDVPFDIHDRPTRTVNLAAAALLRLLGMAAGRVGAADLLDVIALPAIAERHGLNVTDRDVLVGWVRESGIRWAIDEQDRARHGLPANRENTWGFGLDRLLIGWALPLGGKGLFEGVLPFDEIEGSTAELLGRFVAACEQIFAWMWRLAAPRPMAEWHDELSALLADLTDSDDEILAWPAQQVRFVLDAMLSGAEASGLDRPIELATVRLLLEAELDGERKGGGQARGAVTFSSLLPGRTNSARVVAILGADDAVFPRQRASLGFDLLRDEERAGDYDPGSDDRQRFIEAIMAATETVIITYTGRSIASNERIAPAVPLGELLDVVDASFVMKNGAKTTRSHVVVEHPLQSFSPKNFMPRGDDALPPGHDGALLAAASRLREERSERPPFVNARLASRTEFDRSIVRLEDLARWIESPARYFLQTRLRINMGRDAVPLEERETIVVDNLLAWRVRDPIIPLLLGGKPATELYPIFNAGGMLPHGDGGRLAFDNCADEASAIATAVHVRRGAFTSRLLPVDVDLAGVRITGRIEGIYDQTQLLWRAGSIQPKHTLSAWVKHLAFCAVSELAGQSAGIGTVQIGKKAKKVASGNFAPVANARLLLRELVDLHHAGLQIPIPFFPATSRAFADARRKNRELPVEEAFREARGVWLTTAEPLADFCDANDAYVGRLFGGWHPGDDSPTTEEFADLALRVWEPVFAHVTEADVA
ncbi:MAG: exodeoxyribonuclease V subunit gamma, partial [Gemmatimonadaceae bacterium]